jgi:hypothetical protein
MSLTDAILLESHRDPKDIWIAFRTDGNAGSGTERDPYNANTDEDEERFDSLMRGFDQAGMDYISFHIGPGLFKTKGTGGDSSGPTVGWRVRTGWKIRGSGIDVTSFKVVGATATNVGPYHAIGTKFFEPANYGEASDLTVDCNILEHSGVAIGAVAIKGSHTRVRRIRATNFGTYQPGAPECFVISLAGRAGNLPEPTDCLIEDCMVEKRAQGITGLNNITCLNMGSGETRSDGVMEHPRGCVIRNCFVDGAYSDGTVDLGDAAWGCSISGRAAVIEGNRFFNVKTGASYHDTWSHADKTIRRNYCRNVVFGVYEHVGGISSTTSSIRLKSLTSSGTTAHAETYKAHGFVSGDVVSVRNLSSNPPDPSDPDLNYYGSFDVTPHPTNPTLFDYEMSSAPTHSPPPASNHVPAYATAVSKPDDARRLLSSLTYSSSTLIAEAHIADSVATYGIAFTKHDLKPGDIVAINNASPGDFNGRFTVIEAPDDKTFRFQLKSDPGSNSNSGYYGKVWQTKNLVIEKNVFELSPVDGSAGVQIDSMGLNLGPPYKYPQVIIRSCQSRLLTNGEHPAKSEIKTEIRELEDRLTQLKEAIS